MITTALLHAWWTMPVVVWAEQKVITSLLHRLGRRRMEAESRYNHEFRNIKPVDNADEAK